MEVVHRYKVFKGLKFFLSENGDIIVTIHKETLIQGLLDTDPSRFTIEMVAEKRRDGKPPHTHMPPRAAHKIKDTHSDTSTPRVSSLTLPASFTTKDQSSEDERW